MEIKYVNHSVANRYPNLIELNKNLKKYPELLKPILEHELKHTDQAFSIKDLKLDFLSDDRVNQWQLIKFMFKYPASFVQFSPILIRNKKLIIDPNLLIMYSIMLVVFITTIYLGGKYL